MLAIGVLTMTIIPASRQAIKQKATSDTAFYLWEKANIGEEARADIEEYLTGIW